ncbi:MAG: DUF4436 family protein, partial [Micromonosporaceae bacterium]|nr:DUF4436 family protein [Micromonosporaceae bacterium]
GSVIDYPFDQFASGISVRAVSLLAKTPTAADPDDAAPAAEESEEIPPDGEGTPDGMEAGPESEEEADTADTSDYMDLEPQPLGEGEFPGNPVIWQPTAVSLDFLPAVPGLTVAAVPSAKSGGAAEVRLSIARSPATLAVAISLMAIVLLIALGALAVTVRTILRRRSVDVPSVATLGVLLFGVAMLREAMPGAPEFGTRADYLGFSLAEILIGCCVVALLVVQFSRIPQRERAGTPD